MRTCGVIRVMAFPAFVGSCLLATAAFADSCVGIKCGCVGDGCVQQDLVTAAEPEPEEEAPKVTRQKRPRHTRFNERPHAADKTVSAVKTSESFQIRGKFSYRTKSKGFTESEPPPPQFLPVVVSPEAKAALAMEEVASRVQVVDAEELNDIDRTSADVVVPVQVATTAERPFQLASSDNVTFDNRYAAAPKVEPPAPAAEPRTWLSRLAWWPTDALTMLAAGLRHLLN